MVDVDVVDVSSYLSKKMEIIQNIAIMSILDNYGYNMDQNPYYEVDKR